MQEQEIRRRIRALRDFYQSLIIYALVNAGLVMIWAVSGGGTFWPIWVMVGWGSGLAISAVSLGLFPQLSTLFPVFSDDWEDEQVKKQLEKTPLSKMTSTEKTPAKAVKKESSAS